MKHNFRIVSYIIILLFQISSIAQEKPFKQLVQELNKLYEIYDPIYPYFGQQASLSEYGISYQQLQKDYPDIEELEISKNKDSISSFGLVYYYQNKIIEKFEEITRHPELLKHDLPKMLNAPVLVSDDKKLYSLSIDEKTGGTYLSRITMYHYTGSSTTSETVFEDFTDDGYNEIYTLRSKSGTKYLLIGAVRTCSTCMATYALLTHYENGKFVQDFETVLEGRFSGEITYNPKTKVLSASYQTSDLMKECSCTIGEEQFAIHAIGEMETDIKDCSCTYKFDGSTFKLTSQLSRTVKE